MKIGKIEKVIQVEFIGDKNLYDGRHLEIRQPGSQIRFYEVDEINKSEYCLSRDVVNWLVHKRSIPMKQVVKKALKGDKSIF